MRRTDLIKSPAKRGSYKLNNNFMPINIPGPLQSSSSLRRTIKTNTRKMNMRQFFSIDPDLVQTHTISHRPLIDSLYSTQNGPKMFSMTPQGKIIKRDNITHKIAKSRL